MKIISVAGARPNFVKLAAVDHALREDDELTHTIIHTGQHYDPLFSDVFFSQLDIPLPTHNLDVHGGDRESVIYRTAEAIEPVLAEEKPDMVLVYGDVNGAVGAANAAKKLGIALVHVEAGLRSFDMDMPEEHNRIAVDQVADLLLCSEQSGMDNLEKEELKGKAVLVGNTMIDTLIRMLPHIEAEKVPPNLPGQFAVLTMHRPSNVDTKEALLKNIEFLTELSEHISLVLPAHHRFRHAIEQFDLVENIPANLHMIDPLGYIPFLRLVQEAMFVLTDSGGLQEESTYLKKQCFTLRLNTERPSTIESGSNTLINLDDVDDRTIVFDTAKNPQERHITIPQYWDGKTGKRIVEQLKDYSS